MSTFDLAPYFKRIGYTGTPTPSLETLRELHRRHAEAIPFENLDPLLKRPVNLDPLSLERKLVHERRGGYCFEQNGLFAAVLEAIGFRITRLGARVVYGQSADAATARTHMLLRVDIGDESHLADVGFGGLVLTAPLRLAVDVEQATPHEPFRLVHWNDEYLMEAQVREAWVPLYRFTLVEQLPIDYEVGSWYVSTYPASFFTTMLVASRPAPGLRYALRNNELAIHHLRGETERRTLGNAAELRQALSELLLIELPTGAEVDALIERIAATPPAP